MISRRNLLFGAIAAPAIVRASSLMAISPALLVEDWQYAAVKWAHENGRIVEGYDHSRGLLMLRVPGAPWFQGIKWLPPLAAPAQPR